jgi:hypothetical protein
MLARGWVTLDNEKTAMLLDDLAALDLAHRREVITEWRRWPRPSPGCLMVTNSVH